jgi:hypothetical protein
LRRFDRGDIDITDAALAGGSAAGDASAALAGMVCHINALACA